MPFQVSIVNKVKLKITFITYREPMSTIHLHIVLTEVYQETCHLHSQDKHFTSKPIRNRSEVRAAFPAE